MEPLSFLLYASQAIDSLEERARLALENKAKLHINLGGITGVLVYRQGFFMQYLEGHESHVLEFFRKLRGNENHFNVRVLSRGNIQNRLFPNWSIRIVPDSNRTPSSQSLIDLFETILTPKSMPPNEINLILNKFWKDSEILHLNQ